MKPHFNSVKNVFIDSKGKKWDAENLDELIGAVRDLRRSNDTFEHYFDIEELD